MSTYSSALLDDKRPIIGVWPPDPMQEGYSPYKVGLGGITKIEAYGEPGPFCMVPWIAVWKGDVCVARMNAHHVAEIWYTEEA